MDTFGHSAHPPLDEDFLDALPKTLSDILPGMVEAGLTDIATQLEELKRHANSDINQTDMIRCIHSIKSCSNQLGGAELAEFARNKEAEYSNEVPRQLEEDIDSLTILFSRFQRELLRYMAERADKLDGEHEHPDNNK